MSRDLSVEFAITSTVLVGFILSALIVMFLVRRRILLPLRDLGDLLIHLGRNDYRSMSSQNTDPMLRPLVRNYNQLVEHLAELERENASRRLSLEHQVRMVTQALLEQHRSLATAERLAAVGEVAARIAHELRNPLAGIQVALSNIRRECDEHPDVVERLGLIIDELRRVTGLLNAVLDQSRHTPEVVVKVSLRKELDDLLALARYEIPERIRLVTDIAADLACRLPKDALRQAVLNLTLNAAGAIGDREGAVTIQAFREHGQLVLTVSDDGPGFAPELLEHGGRPFQTGRPGGTGLGLATVRRFVSGMHGKMELSNRSPHGARVTLTLPCRAASCLTLS